jgi:hypothetical protein
LGGVPGFLRRFLGGDFYLAGIIRRKKGGRDEMRERPFTLRERAIMKTEKTALNQSIFAFW